MCCDEASCLQYALRKPGVGIPNKAIPQFRTMDPRLELSCQLKGLYRDMGISSAAGSHMNCSIMRSITDGYLEQERTESYLRSLAEMLKSEGKLVDQHSTLRETARCLTKLDEHWKYSRSTVLDSMAELETVFNTIDWSNCQPSTLTDINGVYLRSIQRLYKAVAESEWESFVGKDKIHVQHYDSDVEDGDNDGE